MNVVNVLGYPGKQTTTRNHHGTPPKILVNRERTPGRYHPQGQLARATWLDWGSPESLPRGCQGSLRLKRVPR